MEEVQIHLADAFSPFAARLSHRARQGGKSPSPLGGEGGLKGRMRGTAKPKNSPSSIYADGIPSSRCRDLLPRGEKGFWGNGFIPYAIAVPFAGRKAQEQGANRPFTPPRNTPYVSDPINPPKR